MNKFHSMSSTFLSLKHYIAKVFFVFPPKPTACNSVLDAPKRNCPHGGEDAHNSRVCAKLLDIWVEWGPWIISPAHMSKSTFANHGPLGLALFTYKNSPSPYKYGSIVASYKMWGWVSESMNLICSLMHMLIRLWMLVLIIIKRVRAICVYIG